MNGIARMGCMAALMLGLTAFVAGSALALDNPWTTTLTSSQGGYSNTMVATVTWNVDHYHYLYELNFQQTFVRASDQYSYPMTVLTVGNTPNFAYRDAGNDVGWVNPTHNPNNPGANSVLWTSTGGTPVPVGRVMKFWYDSIYAPQVVTVSMTAGRAGGNQTLGMAPEPGALASLGAGIVALGGVMLRRRFVK